MEHGKPAAAAEDTVARLSPEAPPPAPLPKGFSVCFYDEQTGETVACPRDYGVECIGRGHYLFRKGDIAYGVDLEEGTCTCPDFIVRRSARPGAGCKHMRLARVLLRHGRVASS